MTLQTEALTPTLEQHEVRITALEKADEQTQKRLDALERNHNDLKVTIMEENRDTRKFMQSLIERQIISNDADRVRDDELRKDRMSIVRDVVITLFGAGGLISVIVQFFIN